MSSVNDTEEKKQIFRQASLDRIASPEQTDDYLRMPSVSIWLVMSAAILLAAGLIAWLVLGV